MMKVFTLILISISTLTACTKSMNNAMSVNTTTMGNDTIPAPPDTITYLALGDSYTIGESVPAGESFPYQLIKRLKTTRLNLPNPTIIARTGWTTDELIGAIDQSHLNKSFSFVTLLIGVNNQYRKYDINTYQKEFVQLLDSALVFANGNKTRVFVLSIPDYGVTPFAGRDDSKIGPEIDQYNAINKDESLKAGVNYLDITGISRQAATDDLLIAPDGLHPSGKMYGLWMDQLAPLVAAKLK